MIYITVRCKTVVERKIREIEKTKFDLHGVQQRVFLLIYRQREREKKDIFYCVYYFSKTKCIYMYTLLVLDKKNANLQMSTTDEYATIFQKSKLT
jgi:hypothetical protein